MAEKRYSPRLAFRCTVKYGKTEPPEKTSFLTDMSDTGICIKTNNVFPPGTKVHISVDVDGVLFKAEGVVMWAKIVPPGLVRVVKNGMGIKFTNMEPELLSYYNRKKEARQIN